MLQEDLLNCILTSCVQVGDYTMLVPHIQSLMTSIFGDNGAYFLDVWDSNVDACSQV